MTIGGFSGQQGVTREVLFWPGDPMNVPPGWVLCDGNNGTPDMTEHFMKGQGTNDAWGPNPRTGGNSYTLIEGQLPPHSHSVSVSGIGNHDHDYDVYGGLESEEPWSSSYIGPGGGDRSTSANGEHSHGLEISNSGGSSAVDNRPRAMRLVFIMKA